MASVPPKKPPCEEQQPTPVPTEPVITPLGGGAGSGDGPPPKK